MYKKIFWFFFALLIFRAGLAQEQRLHLADALALAQKENRRLQVSFLESQKAEEAIKEERSLLLPTVTASAGYTFYAERPVIFLRDQASPKKVNAIEVGGRHATNMAVSASFPILEPTLYSRIKMAEINAHLQKEKNNDLTSGILLEVALKYYTIQFFNEQVWLFQQSLKRNEQALIDARLLLQQGKGLKADTLRNYIDVQNVKASILQLENKIKVEGLYLKQLIGLDMRTPITLVDKLEGESTDNLLQRQDGLIHLAMENRSDMKAQKLAIAYFKEEQEKVKAAFKPSLHAIAQYQLQSQADQFRFWNYTFPRTSFVGIQLNVPIYSGWREKYRTNKAHYTMHQAAITAEELKQTITVEISSLIEKTKDAYLQREIQDKNVEAAQLNYSMINERFKQGLSSRLELADAEVILTQAKINQLHAVYVLKTMELQLKKATGLLKAE